MSRQIFTYREKRERTRIRNAILERDGHTCQYCGVALTPCAWRAKRAPTAATVDHVIPKSKGGPFTAENLVACCHACNTARGNGEAFSIPRALRSTPGAVSRKQEKSDGKSASLTLKLKADSGYSSDETHRIDTGQWIDILLILGDAEGRRKIAAAGDFAIALQSIANSTCCGNCQEAALVARTALSTALGEGGK